MPERGQKNRAQLLLVVGSFFLVRFLFFILPGVLEEWNHQANDRLFQLRYSLFGKLPVNPEIIHVDLDDSSVRKLKEKVHARSLYGRIIQILSAAEVNAIAFDIAFINPIRSSDDQELIQATEASGRVYYPLILRLEGYGHARELILPEPEQREILKRHLWDLPVQEGETALKADKPLPVFSELGIWSKGMGHITAYPDRDGVFRRFPLVIRYKDGYFPSLIFRVVCDYLQVTPDRIDVSLGKQIVLRGARYPDGTKRDIEIPVDEQGRIIVNFAGPWTDSFPHYSFSKLLEAGDDEGLLEMLRDEIEGDLAIVSDVSTGGRDIGSVPMENIYPLSGLHANIANSILTRNFLQEQTRVNRVFSDLFVVVLLAFFAMSFRPLYFSLLTLLLLLSTLFLSAWFFLFQNTIMDMVCPLLGILLCLITVNLRSYLVEEREKRFLRRRFESYFPPLVLKKILRAPDKLRSSEKKALTILFSDISGFTSWCATREPEEIRATLNEYFSEMSNIVFKYQGTIDKFIGDGLMVFFGDPVEYPDHAARAVKAAIEMQEAAEKLRRRWEGEDRLPLKIRIGINTGEVIVGDMGSERRMDYTVLGANVNLAQRLESQAPVGGILVSESVHEMVRDFVRAEFAGKITAKGIEKEFGVYTISAEKET